LGKYKMYSLSFIGIPTSDWKAHLASTTSLKGHGQLDIHFLIKKISRQVLSSLKQIEDEQATRQ